MSRLPLLQQELQQLEDRDRFFTGENEMKKRLCVSALLILLGALMIFLGTERGEDEAVYQKSTVTCLECVGIG